MALECRTADPDGDAAAVAAIYRPAVTDSVASFETEPPTAEEMAERLRSVLTWTPWLVAVEDGRVIGYAYASRHRDRAAYRWSVDVSAYIDEEHRGQGVGRFLYDRLIPILVRQGFAN